MVASLLVEVDDGVARLTSNRPERRNALDAELRRRLWTTLTELDPERRISVIVLTGADPAFCSGVGSPSMDQDQDRPSPR